VCHSSHQTKREFLPVCSRPSFSAFKPAWGKVDAEVQSLHSPLLCICFAALFLNTILPAKTVFLWNKELRRMLAVLYIIAFGTVIPFGLYFMGIEHLRST